MGKEEPPSKEYSCRLCGEPFDTFGDMQRHELVKHVQQGDVNGQPEK